METTKIENKEVNNDFRTIVADGKIGTVKISDKPVETKKEKPKTMNGWLEYYKPQFANALAKRIDVDLFLRQALTAFNNDSKFRFCDPMSFIGALMVSAQLGLEPNTPLQYAYLIPFKIKGENKVQFQLGYKGLLELAHRSGKIKMIYAYVVYENDEFSIEYGDEPKIIHKPCLKDKGEAVGYYAYYHTINGGKSFEFMTKDEVIEFAQLKSKTYKYGAWQTDFNEMAKKTVLKKLLKYAPLSIESQIGVANDETVKTTITDNILEQKNEMVWDDETTVLTSGTWEDEVTATIDRRK